MADKQYDLEERTSLFAEKVVCFCKLAPKTIVTTPLITQLVRSATSVGANYFEANGAASKKDFFNKIYICKKEAKETMYWLRLIAHSLEKQQEECQTLWKEPHELTLIFSKITSNTKA
jgi:four helix bundle protein